MLSEHRQLTRNALMATNRPRTVRQPSAAVTCREEFDKINFTYLFCIVLRCFVLLCCALFCFVLLCFALFCFTLFYFVLLCFTLFYFVLLCFTLFYFVLLCFTLFYLVLPCFTSVNFLYTFLSTLLHLSCIYMFT